MKKYEIVSNLAQPFGIELCEGEQFFKDKSRLKLWGKIKKSFFSKML